MIQHTFYYLIGSVFKVYKYTFANGHGKTFLISLSIDFELASLYMPLTGQAHSLNLNSQLPRLPK